MSALHAQLAARATELLGDGLWHPFEQTMRSLIKLVPPGLALRRNERDRLRLHRQRGVNVGGPRVQQRPTEELIFSGARAIVRDFLHNTAFETDRMGVPQAGGNYDRQIRMVAKLRSSSADTLRIARERAQLENERLRDQVTLLRTYLIGIGEQAAADRLAPPLEQPDRVMRLSSHSIDLVRLVSVL